MTPDHPSPPYNPGGMETWSLILDEPADGAANMAADESLLDAVGAGARGPTLRFYRWRPACLSLGVFQRFADYDALPADLRPPGLVRRITGGGAIWHGREWTYSVVLPRRHPLSGRDPNPLYRAVHSGIIDGLGRIGVACRLRGASAPGDPAACRASPCRDELFCFTRGDPNDIVAPDGRKIVGSAQRRLESAVLQHGSIVLETPPGSPTATSVADQLGRPADEAAVLAACRDALADRLGVTWRADALSADEAARARALVLSKHTHPDWLRRK